MPAILRAVLESEGTLSNLEKRQGHSGQRRPLSSSAIAFLVPLFIVFLFGPFLCIYLVRSRCSRRLPPPTIPAPTISREEAKAKLKTATEISKPTYKWAGLAHKDSASSSDSASIYERECTICLSTLYSPATPEPVKLAGNTESCTAVVNAQDIVAVKPTPVPSLSISEKEEISRLKVCSHEFHAECLISWFMIRRYDCPVCRAKYYSKEDEKKAKEEEDAQAETRPSQTETRGGYSVIV